MRLFHLVNLAVALAFISGCATGAGPMARSGATKASDADIEGANVMPAPQKADLAAGTSAKAEPESGELSRLLSNLNTQNKGAPGAVRLAAATEAAPAKAGKGGSGGDNNAEAIPSYPENRPYKDIQGVSQYLIGVGDVLEIIAFTRGVSQAAQVVVPPGGKISYSFVQDVLVDGLTTSEAKTLIMRGLAKFVKQPMIDVLVREYNSKKVSLFGEINRVQGVALSGPAIYPLRGKTTILDLLLLAGSATPEADLKRVELTRANKVYALDLDRALTKGDLTQNIILETNDRVVIPKKQELLLAERVRPKISIIGESRNPGSFDFEPGKKEIPLLEGISKAGGFTTLANIKKVRVIRRDSEKGMVVMESNLAKLREGDIAQNIMLQDGDIIFIDKALSGKINEVLGRISPVLSFLLFPATYRDLYTTGGGLRVNTGFPPAGAAGGISGTLAQEELLRRTLPTAPIAP